MDVFLQVLQNFQKATTFKTIFILSISKSERMFCMFLVHTNLPVCSSSYQNDILKISHS